MPNPLQEGDSRREEVARRTFHSKVKFSPLVVSREILYHNNRIKSVTDTLLKLNNGHNACNRNNYFKIDINACNNNLNDGRTRTQPIYKNGKASFLSHGSNTYRLKYNQPVTREKEQGMRPKGQGSFFLSPKDSRIKDVNNFFSNDKNVGFVNKSIVGSKVRVERKNEQITAVADPPMDVNKSSGELVPASVFSANMAADKPFLSTSRMRREKQLVGGAIKADTPNQNLPSQMKTLSLGSKTNKNIYGLK